MIPSPRHFRRFSASVLSLWLLLSPTGLVGAAILPSANSLALVATHGTETRQESYRQQGKRGGQQGNLALQSTGNATVEGSALAAGQHLALDVAGNLKLTAAQSSRQANIQRSNINSHEATSLTFRQSEILRG